MYEIFTDEFLAEIGFKRMPNPKTTKENYGRAHDIRGNGMTVLTWNTQGASCTYFGEPLSKNTYLVVGKDGDTRKAFNGYVFSQDDVRKILSLTC